MPIRERALENGELFVITEEELINRVSELKGFKNIKQI